MCQQETIVIGEKEITYEGKQCLLILELSEPITKSQDENSKNTEAS